MVYCGTIANDVAYRTTCKRHLHGYTSNLQEYPYLALTGKLKYVYFFAEMTAVFLEYIVMNRPCATLIAHDY